MEKGKEFHKRKAVALLYDPSDSAPKIVASGSGYLAEKIISEGEKNQVPIHEDHQLADTLSRLEIGDYIPKELYAVVAEILVFVDKTDKIKGKINGKK
ncbi:MAG: EscU/YscU/HrcU family type III secretion system export apparatus switch protein [Lachnospiraceae bacterium]|nr:EscU/YscU/HrcU family type III secretion system export apparatus switch protein [Lachnospiraceae bacterium]